MPKQTALAIVSLELSDFVLMPSLWVVKSLDVSKSLRLCIKLHFIAHYRSLVVLVVVASAMDNDLMN